MDLIRNRYLVYPVLFVAFFFALDKIFLLPEVRDNFIQPGGMIYYRQRQEQLKKFKALACQAERDRRLVAVLGDSRSFALGQDMIKEERHRDIDLFNFSGPQAIPVYHLYIAEKLLQGGCLPDAILLGVAPDTMNQNSPVFVSPNLNFGVDARFIERYRTLIPTDVYDSYRGTRRFALAGLGFSLNEFLARVQGSLAAEKTEFGAEIALLEGTLGRGEGGARRALLEGILRSSLKNLTLYRFDQSQHRLVLDATRGAQYSWFGSMDDAELQEETRRLREFYLSRFAPSAEQMYFYERLLERAAEARVPVHVFWPRVNPHLRKVYAGEKQITNLWRAMQRVAAKHDASSIDLNRTEAAACRHYYDASHLSISCFPAITTFLLDRLSP